MSTPASQELRDLIATKLCDKPSYCNPREAHHRYLDPDRAVTP